MKIAVLGPGGIGSTFAFELARAGHEVTVVARGKRLEQLQRDRAIVTVAGERAAVSVNATLDTTTEWDLVLVTVLVSQVDVVLPALASSAAKTVMFMFNTFEPLGRLRDAVGPSRFAFGFPAILATLDDGKLGSEIVTRGLLTTVTDAAWAKVFTDAGIPAVVHADMESWLRTHAALVVPVMIASATAHARRAGVSWSEATRLARAMDEGFRLVRLLGNTLTPTPVAMVSRLPIPVLTSLLWSISRIDQVRKTGAAGYGEPRALIDAMAAAAPGEIPALRAIRP
ncbi:ketopantoate reductase family protein [Polyangium jinanense]|uniref:NAD(P)-binding domain-containing protein n=1 Tax=Polyangium jinanense TaxID=2829994 RepID=A0A9X3XBY5_9BACT|nr:2-dehydropantoate 2-reductase N-terminal domain-containing protein [Polyangium jinanense]MDC3959617.1 NAD(P)-binding domain-containing protein [Polyangium jinanense]MDC3986535.1 NAD(P)-binding domain-containing protein [Polyangium jinanense]